MMKRFTLFYRVRFDAPRIEKKEKKKTKKKKNRNKNNFIPAARDLEISINHSSRHRARTHIYTRSGLDIHESRIIGSSRTAAGIIPSMRIGPRAS